ncbi:pyrrolo-quinoline quinone [Campylobacter sp. MIT 12-5580]|uniref:AAA family ATPase n=1 Tax=Campylobacter sp. MIT 12-5580 TaxID=2040651 RepID=UPI0010F497CB|nr:AAA family ATPase [Campylobacter sp. MIT 12-5580]TKX30268.1 pyrrolo-quinoline quinone [Campylobacter sp. MIT 12-5580]
MNYISRIQKLRKVLGEGLLEKEEAIALTLLCMIAGKSIFLYGPAGTAKSLVARRVSQAFQSHKFFDYLMNKFSTPEEVFGPLKLSELRKDNLERNIEGFLPAADFAFLDEIFKSSPAILNALLTIINEKKFRNGKENIKVPLKALVAASNELPAKNQGLEALYDRFIMRLIVPRLDEKDNFAKLLQTLPLNEEIKLDEALKFSNDELENIKEKAKKVELPKEIIDILLNLKARIELFNKELETNQEVNVNFIDVSERRWIVIMELLRFAVVLSDRTKMKVVDLLLIKHCLWSNEEQKEVVEKLLNESLSGSNTQILKYEKEFEEQKEGIIESLEEEVFYYKTLKKDGKVFIHYEIPYLNKDKKQEIAHINAPEEDLDKKEIFQGYKYDSYYGWRRTSEHYYCFNKARNKCLIYINVKYNDPSQCECKKEISITNHSKIVSSRISLKIQAKLKEDCEEMIEKFQAELDMIKKKKEVFCKENQNAFIDQENEEFQILLQGLETEKSTCEQLVIETKKLKDKVEKHPNIKG